jgi:hypothetical protein
MSTGVVFARLFAPIRVALFASSLAVCAVPVAGWSETLVVVPNAYENANANTGSKIPFQFPAARFQQLFEASQFSAITGPQRITEIAFRQFNTTSSFDTTLGDVQINLSTTSATGLTLSATYDSNVGSDSLIVHSGPLRLSSTGTSMTVKPFDIAIPLNPGFDYDPSLGNLLLEVRVIDASGRGPVPFFNADGTQETDARVFCQSQCSVDDSVAQKVDGLAIVARFTFAPEPDSTLLGVTALLPLVWRARRPRSHRR